MSKFQNLFPWSREANSLSEEQRKKRLLWFIIFIAAAIMLIASLVVLIIKLVPEKEEYHQFKNDITSSDEEALLPENPINFEAVKEQNSEVCAWIQVDGTIIDYPILQSGDDNVEDYYLNHGLDGKYSSAGAIYIQKCNNANFLDQNTLIYGHNMLNGTMFAQLKKFRNKDFFDENRYIYIYTPKHIFKYEIFSAFVYDDRHILNAFNFQLHNEYQAFIDECLNPTSFTKQVLEDAEVYTSDRIITLSTCTGNDSERYLVVGVLVEDTVTK